MEIADVLPILHGPEADLIGGADHTAAVDAATGQPDGEAVGIVVPAAIPLLHRGPAELAPPDHEGLVEETAPGEVGEERGGRPVSLP